MENKNDYHFKLKSFRPCSSTLILLIFTPRSLLPQSIISSTKSSISKLLIPDAQLILVEDAFSSGSVLCILSQSWYFWLSPASVYCSASLFFHVQDATAHTLPRWTRFNDVWIPFTMGYPDWWMHLTENLKFFKIRFTPNLNVVH